MFEARNTTPLQDVGLRNLAVLVKIRKLLFHFFFLGFRRAASTRLGLPAGCPSRFFCRIRFAFSLFDISLPVLGVFEEMRFEGRQYGVPRFSPF